MADLAREILYFTNITKNILGISNERSSDFEFSSDANEYQILSGETPPLRPEDVERYRAHLNEEMFWTNPYGLGVERIWSDGMDRNKYSLSFPNLETLRKHVKDRFPGVNIDKQVGINIKFSVITITNQTTGTITFLTFYNFLEVGWWKSSIVKVPGVDILSRREQIIPMEGLNLKNSLSPVPIDYEHYSDSDDDLF